MPATQYGYDGVTRRTTRVPDDYQGWGIPGWGGLAHYFMAGRKGAICSRIQRHVESERFLALPDDRDDARCAFCKARLEHRRLKAGA